MVSFASYVIKTWDSRELFRLFYLFTRSIKHCGKCPPGGLVPTHAAFLIRARQAAQWKKHLKGSGLTGLSWEANYFWDFQEVCEPSLFCLT